MSPSRPTVRVPSVGGGLVALPAADPPEPQAASISTDARTAGRIVCGRERELNGDMERPLGVICG